MTLLDAYAARLMESVINDELKALLVELQTSPPDAGMEERCIAKARVGRGSDLGPRGPAEARRWRNLQAMMRCSPTVGVERRRTVAATSPSSPAASRNPLDGSGTGASA